MATDMKEILPVIGKPFSNTTKALISAIVNVNKSIKEQIIGLTTKQDQLMKKQDETTNNFLEISNSLTEACLEMSTFGSLYLTSNNAINLCLYQIFACLIT